MYFISLLFLVFVSVKHYIESLVPDELNMFIWS